MFRYHIATAGNDRFTKIWDLRNMQRPLLSLSAHAHWTTAVRFNPKHDQILLTADTTGRVNLWDVNSVSSVSVQFLFFHVYARVFNFISHFLLTI